MFRTFGILILVLSLTPSLLAQGKKIALVVGVNRYHHSELNKPAPLEYAEADAEEFSQELKKSNYEVVLLKGKEATLQAIRTQLDLLRKKPGEGGIFVVALAGHGMQPESTREAYYCPYDADQRFVPPGDPNKDPWDYRTMLPLTEVVGQFRASSASERMLLVDACRNDPESGRGRGVGTGLRVGDFPQNTAVLLSCSRGQRAFEDEAWKHGAFFYHVLEGLRGKARDRLGRVTDSSLYDHVELTVPGEVTRIIKGGAEQTPDILKRGRVNLRIEAGGLAKTRVLDLPGGVKLELVLVPKGTFWMSENGENAQKQVTIDHDFYIGKYEVTQEQWQAVMGSNPSYFSRVGDGKDRVKDIGDIALKQFPVENVSWEDCQAFLKKLNERNRDGEWLYRLPKEAEWEYSCRGGATSKEDCSFHFYFKKPSNSLSSEQANFDGNYPFGDAPKGKDLGHPTKVGSYEANALGLYDMHGNVGEWCDDWYTDKGIKEGSDRVFRGGSWLNSGSGCRAAYRSWYTPSDRSLILGLRVALVPSRR